MVHRRVSRPVYQRFVDYLQIFRPETVQVVIAFSEEVDRFVICLNKATDETFASETEHLKLHARDILSAYTYAKASLLGEGARVVDLSTTTD